MLWKLTLWMEPTLRCGEAAAIPTSWLRQRGIRGVIWDVDGTLTACDGVDVPRGLRGGGGLLDDPLLKHVLVSNCADARVEALATLFPDVPILRVYEAGGDLVVRKRLGSDERLVPPEGSVGRPLRKPDPRLIDAALRELGLGPREVVAIGDQYMTDIAVANAAGASTVLVDTLEIGSFAPAVRLLKLAESVWYQVTRPVRRLAGPRVRAGNDQNL